MKGKKTVADRLAQYGAVARGRWAGRFSRVSLQYPPDRVILLGIKDEANLEVWAAQNGHPYRHVHTFPVLAASGRLGPKLHEGDLQVPEGVYHVESLNPNSMYHLSLRLNYPNDFDRNRAREDGRDHLGSDIMIHGKACSIGCLAMGDEAAEDLFVLVAETHARNVQVILTPVDFRKEDMPDLKYVLPKWTAELYEKIRQALLQIDITPGGALRGIRVSPKESRIETIDGSD